MSVLALIDLYWPDSDPQPGFQKPRYNDMMNQGVLCTFVCKLHLESPGAKVTKNHCFYLTNTYIVVM